MPPNTKKTALPAGQTRLNLVAETPPPKKAPISAVAHYEPLFKARLSIQKTSNYLRNATVGELIDFNKKMESKIEAKTKDYHRLHHELRSVIKDLKQISAKEDEIKNLKCHEFTDITSSTVGLEKEDDQIAIRDLLDQKAREISSWYQERIGQIVNDALKYRELARYATVSVNELRVLVQSVTEDDLKRLPGSLNSQFNHYLSVQDTAFRQHLNDLEPQDNQPISNQDVPTSNNKRRRLL
jgi:seryl-tRNA synthetase